MPVEYHWSLVMQILPLLPFVVLLSLFFLKPNRRKSAWLIWVPVVLILLVVTALLMFCSNALSGMDSYALPVVTGTVLGLAVVWLVSYKMARLWRIGALSVVWMIMSASSFVLTLCSGEWSAVLVFQFVFAVITSLMVVLGMAGAGFCCRRRYSPRRFTLWLFPCTMLAAALVLLPFVCIQAVMLMVQGNTAIVTVVLLSWGVASLVVGLVMALLVWPFLILAFKCSLYRDRLYSILRLPGMCDKERDVEGDMRHEDTHENSGL